MRSTRRKGVDEHPPADPVDPTPTDTPADEKQVTVETALQWLQRAKPADVLTALKHTDFALTATRAFLGFRFNAQGLHNPLVRRRLADDIVRDPKLQALLQPLADMPSTERSSHQTPTAQPGRDNEADALKEQLRSERDQRKRDRADARAALDEVKRANADLARRVEQGEATLAAALAESDSLRDALKRAQLRIERLERQNRRMSVENALLVKAAKPVEPGTDARSPSTDQAPVAKTSPFEAAAYRLVSQENLEAALVLAEAALTEDPGNPAALEIATTVYQKSGDRRGAARTARALVLSSLQASNLKAATDALLTLLTVDTANEHIGAVIRPYAQAVRSAESTQTREIAAAFARFAAVQPAAYRRLATLIDEHLPADLARSLTTTAATGPTDALPLQMPEPITAAAIVDAVDASDEVKVSALRKALAHLRDSSPDEFDRVIAAIEDAAGGDESYLKPLIGQTRGPAIVDASNVAWHDDAKGMAERPRLRQILLVRAAVRRRGFFPILLIADAPLPHTIDDRESFAKMLVRGAVTVSTTGTDADETIVREARRLGAVVISNDYMADWDPGGEVAKLRYIIPPSGPAYLLG